MRSPLRLLIRAEVRRALPRYLRSLLPVSILLAYALLRSGEPGIIGLIGIAVLMALGAVALPTLISHDRESGVLREYSWLPLSGATLATSRLIAATAFCALSATLASGLVLLVPSLAAAAAAPAAVTARLLWTTLPVVITASWVMCAMASRRSLAVPFAVVMAAAFILERAPFRARLAEFVSDSPIEGQLVAVALTATLLMIALAAGAAIVLSRSLQPRPAPLVRLATADEA